MTKKLLSTTFGDIAYFEVGSPLKPPVLFVHGIPTSSYLWRHVLRFLQHDFHCYAPDLMGLGDTDVDPDRTLFHMDAQAEMLEEFMRSLGHHTFGLVCHDQGGAAGQILAANRPHLIRCLVLTDCVCYDNWPVPTIAGYQALMRIPVLPDLLLRAGFFQIKETITAISSFRTGVYEPRKLTNEAISEYLRPLISGKRSRERMRKFFLAGKPSYTQRAVAGLRKFDKPTLIVWGADDRHISPSWGLKLAEDIPGAEAFQLVPFCGHFWPEERPSEFTSYIGPFLSRHCRDEA